MIKAALFDFDGTLVDSDPIHLACWNQVLNKFGVAIDDQFYAAYCVGGGSVNIAERIKQDLPAVSISAVEFAREKDECYQNWIGLHAIPTMPGVTEMLKYLKEKNIVIGLVTGAAQNAIQKTLEENEIANYFCILVTREFIIHGKPAPDGYLFALHQLGKLASETVSFEDTRSGVQASKAAGIYSFAIPHRYTASHDFRDADEVCQNLMQAKEILIKSIGE
jgi:beta-phosphoglucomutase